jgi:hypothetical protein
VPGFNSPSSRCEFSSGWKKHERTGSYEQDRLIRECKSLHEERRGYSKKTLDVTRELGTKYRQLHKIVTKGHRGKQATQVWEAFILENFEWGKSTIYGDMRVAARWDQLKGQVNREGHKFPENWTRSDCLKALGKERQDKKEPAPAPAPPVEQHTPPPVTAADEEEGEEVDLDGVADEDPKKGGAEAPAQRLPDKPESFGSAGSSGITRDTLSDDRFFQMLQAKWDTFSDRRKAAVAAKVREWERKTQDEEPEDQDEAKKPPVRTDRAYYLGDDEVELAFGEQPAGEGQRGLKWFDFSGSRQLSPSQGRPGSIRLNWEPEKAQELLRGLMETWGVDWEGMSEKALYRYDGRTRIRTP